MGVGVVFHVILHRHVENLITRSDSLCEISHSPKNFFRNCYEIRLGVTIVTTVQVRLASGYFGLDAGGGMILRAIGFWVGEAG